MKAWRHFKFEDFACHCGCGTNLMQESTIDRFDELRERCGFALFVNSGYRCPKYNAQVSDTGEEGPHTTGHAVDTPCDRGKAFIVLKNAVELGFTGLGFQQKGKSRYIHLDDLTTSPRPNIWSY